MHSSPRWIPWPNSNPGLSLLCPRHKKPPRLVSLYVITPALMPALPREAPWGVLRRACLCPAGSVVLVGDLLEALPCRDSPWAAQTHLADRVFCSSLFDSVGSHACMYGITLEINTHTHTQPLCLVPAPSSGIRPLRAAERWLPMYSGGGGAGGGARWQLLAAEMSPCHRGDSAAACPRPGPGWAQGPARPR